MKRRNFIAASALATGVVGVSSFPKPAISQGIRKLRMQTTWPKNYPGLGTGANLLADFITRMSGGKLTVEVFGGGEIVPAFETMDAVGSGTLDMGHGAPYYWKGKAPATQFLASIPFGMNAVEQIAWYQFGGGQELADEVYRGLGCKFFQSGNAGQQMGGWFNKRMDSTEDYKGLKMRIPGLGGEVVRAMGGNVVNLPGAEIGPALASGSIDATEWVGPYNDLASGFYKHAQFYYYPGWHEPATVLDNFINMEVWESLDGESKAIVEAANALANSAVLAEFDARNGGALDVLVRKHKVKLLKFPDQVLNELGEASGQVMDDIASADKDSRRVFDSILDFRRGAVRYAKVANQAFYNARSLPFPYAKSKKMMMKK